MSVDRLNTKEAIEKRRKTRTMTVEQLLEKASKTHTDLDNYDWPKVDLTVKDEKGRVTLFCEKHGEFKIRLTHFINGVGCQYCKGRKKDEEELKQKLQKIHPNLDFSNAVFHGVKEKYQVEYNCPIHGKKSGKLYNLLNGEGCNDCGNERKREQFSMTNEEFIKRANQIFGDKYSYEELDMLKRDENGKVKIRCKEHGIFKVTPANFLLRHSGCPSCNTSKLEEEIKSLLVESNIEFEQQKTFEWLKSKSKLRLDFYLPKYNVAVECQGEQHFKPIKHFGGKEAFTNRLKLDELKRNLCNENSIDILYFSKEKISDISYIIFNNKTELLNAIKKRMGN